MTFDTHRHVALARSNAARLADLLRREHDAMADFLLALVAFDRQRGWADLGHASLWCFLHRDLGLSAGAAYHRKAAADLLQRCPAVEGPLRDGRLCLSSVVELSRVATPGNLDEVLPRFFHRSAREAKEVVAALQSRAVVPRREVVTAVAAADSVADPRAGPFHTYETTLEGREALQPPAPVQAAERPPSTPTCKATPAMAPASTAAPATMDPRRGDLARSAPPDAAEPLTADLRRLHVTVSRRFLEKLDAARAARAHATPGATAEAILEEALDLLLAREARRREAATDRPLATPRPSAPERIPAHVRREVWARDQGRCQWPLHDGGVCGSTHRLELDHVRPRARGGPSTADNLRLLCGAHNAEAARRAFGGEWMARFGRGSEAPPTERPLAVSS
jgi:5-methylcytosine-specific restriction endonuclease McrA